MFVVTNNLFFVLASIIFGALTFSLLDLYPFFILSTYM